MLWFEETLLTAGFSGRCTVIGYPDNSYYSMLKLHLVVQS